MPNAIDTEGRFEWTRFWCPPEESFTVDERGFLADPTQGWFNSNCLTFSDIASKPCLVLLGEPGIGKTITIEDEAGRLAEQGITTNEIVVLRGLRAFASRTDFQGGLFSLPEFDSWRAGQMRLHLFLDGLDESLLGVDRTGAILIDWLRTLPLERLYLRIACRTAEWPQELELSLSRLWPEKLGVFELLPLRDNDVRVASQALLGDESERFMHQVESRRAASFASKPVTLWMLLGAFARDGGLPERETELYRAGITLLADQKRLDSPTTSAGERLAVAGRIAAMTLLCNRFAVYRGRDRMQAQASDLVIDDIRGGTAVLDSEGIQVTQVPIDETLGTGLFTSRGANRMGWSHHTYAEYLAAAALSSAGLSVDELLQLIGRQTKGGPRLIPQLQETTAWLACLNPELFRLLLSIDPLTLLYSDVATSNSEERRSLVEALLRGLDEGEIWMRDWSLRRRLSRLAFSGIADVLRPYIVEKERSKEARETALEIATECEVKELHPELLRLALDSTEIRQLRVEAVRAVAKSGTDDELRSLLPLTKLGVRQDPYDELLGVTLSVLWPRHISTRELFALLRRPRDDSLIGSYRMFLSRDFLQNATGQDMKEALKWAARQKPSYELPYTWQELLNDIFFEAFRRISSSEIVAALGKALASRMRRHDDAALPEQRLTKRTVDVPDDARREVLIEVLKALRSPEEATLLVWGSRPLVSSTDLDWLLEEERRRSGRLKRAMAVLIARLFDYRQPDQVIKVMQAAEDDQPLVEALGPWLGAVDFSSEEAERMRLVWRRSQPEADDDDSSRLSQEAYEDVVVELLKRFSKGDEDAWWQLHLQLVRTGQSRTIADEFESDLRLTPGWLMLRAEVREAVVDAAAQYINTAELRTYDWRKPNVFNRPAHAAFRAWRLLLEERPESLTSLPLEASRRWALLLMWFPLWRGNEAERAAQQLACLAYERAPDEVLLSLAALAEEHEGPVAWDGLSRLEGCWGPRLTTFAHQLLIERHLDGESLSKILEQLLRHERSVGIDIARQLIADRTPEQRQVAIEVASTALLLGERKGWDLVWGLTIEDPPLAAEVFLRSAHGDYQMPSVVAESLTAMELAELYLWLLEQFPGNEEQMGAHTVTPQESIRRWRNQLINELRERGTEEAVDALRTLASQLPGEDWLKRVILDAEVAVQRKGWVPLEPAELREILRRPRARVVSTDRQLLDLLIESLDRLQARLQGETPAAQFLWEEVSQHAFRPRTEAHLSDFIKLHFEQDLAESAVVVDREVEVKSGSGRGLGPHRTDIHVDVFSSDQPSDRIRAIIEVKASWNRRLFADVAAQLATRYLVEHGVPAGLYIVGLFRSPQWDPRDPRERVRPKAGRTELLTRLREEAARASTGGVLILPYVLDCSLNGSTP